MPALSCAHTFQIQKDAAVDWGERERGGGKVVRRTTGVERRQQEPIRHRQLHLKRMKYECLGRMCAERQKEAVGKEPVCSW